MIARRVVEPREALPPQEIKALAEQTGTSQPFESKRDFRGLANHSSRPGPYSPQDSGTRLDALLPVLSGSIRELACELTGSKPTSRTGRDWRFGSRGSLAVVVEGPERGSWFDHEAGSGGDALGLVAHLRRCPMRDAYAWALSWLGMDGVAKHPPLSTTTRSGERGSRGFPSREPTQPTRPTQGKGVAFRDPLHSVNPLQSNGVAFRNPLAGRDTLDSIEGGKNNTLALARQLWREGVAPAGTAVAVYLASRGLTLPEDAPLRFHPACPRGGERLPAMLALMTDPVTAEPCGVHRTFLAPDGRGKAPGQAKMMAGHAGVVRLVPDEAVAAGLGIAEGIETSLRVMQSFGWSPVWAATSAGGIARFPVLRGVEALTIFADADDKGAGEKAAMACAERWREAAKEATIFKAPPGEDFDDSARRVA